MLKQAPRSRHLGCAIVNGTGYGTQRGFTLPELMAVVAITGVLATLATYGVRKYVLAAKQAEATSMLTQIRAAEEAYLDETFSYRGGGDFDTWHPTKTPDSGKRNWRFGDNAMTAVLDDLAIQPNGPVYYSYAVVAGTAGSTVPDIPGAQAYRIPAPTGPYYIAMAMADLNGDGTYTYALTWSGSSEIWVDLTF